MLFKSTSTITTRAQREFSCGKSDTAVPPQNTENTLPTTLFVHKSPGVLTVRSVLSRQTLPQFPPDASRRGEEKEVTWGKYPVTMVCSQKIAANFSVSENLCGYGSSKQSRDHLHYLRVGNDDPSQQCLLDKQ